MKKHGACVGGKLIPEYRAWSRMLSRCYNENVPSYEYYGQRGIEVCERWRNDFAAFLADMGQRPDGTSIDRIDPDKGYEPGNCRWATPKEQSRNRRFCHFVEYGGERLSIAAWAERLGVSLYRLRKRFKAGLPAEQILFAEAQPGVHWKGLKTHCRQGHPYAEHGYIEAGAGHRRCKLCQHAKMRRQAEKRKLAARIPRH